MVKKLQSVVTYPKPGDLGNILGLLRVFPVELTLLLC